MIRLNGRPTLVAGAAGALALSMAAGVMTAPVATAAAPGDVTLYSAPAASTAYTGTPYFLDTVAVVDDTAWASAGFLNGSGLQGLLAANVAGDDSAVQVPVVVAGQPAYICAVEAGPTGGIHEGKVFVSYITGTSNGCTNYAAPPASPDPKGILRIDNATGQVDDSWTIDGLSYNALSGLAFQGDDTLWLGSYGESMVYRMDLTGSRTSPTMTAISVGDCPTRGNSPISQLVTLDDTIYVLNQVCSTLVGISAITDDTVVLAGPYSSFERVAGLEVSPLGDVWYSSHFFVGSPESTIRAYRPSDDSEVASATVEGAAFGIAVPDGSSNVFVSAGNAPTPSNRVYELGLAFGASPSIPIDDTFSLGSVTTYSLVPGLDNRGFVIGASLSPNIVRIATPVVPGAPMLDSASGGPGSITLNWTLGATGGSPITDVEYAMNPFPGSWVSLGTTTSPVTITQDNRGNALTPGQTYTVFIRARNALGPSGNSNSLTATPTDPTPPTPPVTYPPGPPTNVVAVAGDASAAVSWSPPVDSGSFPVTDYEVKASPGGAGCLVKVPATTCTVGGLVNGTTYIFTARALNGSGWGTWSVASGGVTPERDITVPGPVRELRVVKVTAAGVVKLRWLPPASDGGAPVEVYQVRVRRVGTDKYVRVLPDVVQTRATVTGLQPGQRYWFRVRAVNEAGPGLGSVTAQRILIPLN